MNLLSCSTVLLVLGLFSAANSDDETCIKSVVVKGVPNGARFKDATLHKNVTLDECIEKCCANTTCDVAAIHNKFCVMAPCTPACQINSFKVDNADPAAQFVIVNSAAAAPANNSAEPAEHSNLTSEEEEEGVKSAENTKQQLHNQINTATVVANKTHTAPEPSSLIADNPITQNADKEADKNVTCAPACTAHSSCVHKEDKYKCVCDKGYTLTNKTCKETVTCKAESCGEHSTCTVVDNVLKCPCVSGYSLSEEKCALVSCSNVTCPTHSTCTVAQGKQHCFCDKGFVAQDEFCRKDTSCTVEPQNSGCPDNEQCQQVSSKTQCACIPGKLRTKDTGDCTTDAAQIHLTTNNVTITLPVNSANLSVAVSPPHIKNKNYFNYKWHLKSGPKSADTVMEGLTSSQVRLAKLTAGEYTLTLDVSGAHNEYKSTAVALVVNPEPHINHPPVAVIKPAGDLTFKLPADFSLNGIDSHDDEKILSYKWTIEAQPTASTNNLELTGEATDTLHVKVDKGEGKFTFKLEVKDKGKLEASATKTVNILAEDDFPPSAKASKPQVMTLPDNAVTLYGNESKDDHGIVRWEWQKSADSPSTADMQGSTTPELKLSKLIEGTYTFKLTVYDKKGQNSTASTTVTVRPAVKGPPVAKAGDNKELIQPDVSTELDGSGSSSPLGPLTGYKWEAVSGPENLHMVNETSAMLVISGLTVGVYKFKLTVTDKINATASDEVTVTVKEDNNKAPIAVLGPDITLYVPNTAIDIDGSNSTDDNGIVRWKWSRSPTSPALGSIVGHSNTSPILKLCDLIVGEYTFTLTVYDKKELSSSASLTVSVANNPHSKDIVQVFLFEAPANFSQARLDNLRNILMVPFSLDKERSVTRWTLKTIGVKAINEQVVVFFYGVDEGGTIIPGAPLVAHLRDTVYGKVLGYNFDVIDTSTCSNECSGHGVCSDETRLCTCEKFWMENFFKKSAGRQFSNCEWSKIYFVIIMLIIVAAGMAVLYIVWYVIRLRNVQIKKQRRYKLLEEETGRGINMQDSSDDSDYFKMKPRPARRTSNNNNSGGHGIGITGNGNIGNKLK